jgi:hypothetical protein
MRTALLIGLMVLGAASVAQAQAARRNPYDPPKPFELPKEYRTNPNEWDYSKPDPATKGPGYRNADGTAFTPPPRQPAYGGYSGYSGYNARVSGGGDHGVSSSRAPQNPNCSKPGVVC